VNGPGVRERVELAADGAAVIAYGDGRGTRGSSVRVAVVALADPAPAPESWPMIRGPR
jgi:hypothetical protein